MTGDEYSQFSSGEATAEQKVPDIIERVFRLRQEVLASTDRHRPERMSEWFRDEMCDPVAMRTRAWRSFQHNLREFRLLNMVADVIENLRAQT